MATPFLKFKFLKNVRIDFGDGREYNIPIRPYEEMTNLGPVMKAAFDMDKVFTIELEDETPEIPVRGAAQSARSYQARVDQAYTEADERRKRNDEIRKQVNIHARHGNIKVVEDPFKFIKVDESKLDEVEAATAAELASDELPVAKTTRKAAAPKKAAAKRKKAPKSKAKPAKAKPAAAADKGPTVTCKVCSKPVNERGLNGHIGVAHKLKRAAYDALD